MFEDHAQTIPFIISPFSGNRLAEPFTAERWRNMLTNTATNAIWHYNPWTGMPRTSAEVARDPYGRAISLEGLVDWVGKQVKNTDPAKGFEGVTFESNRPQPTTAPDFLERASQIMRERGKQYDSEGGERSMGKTIAAFNTITGRDLSETEGWTLLLLLKQVRLFTNKKEAHRDSCEDTVSYSALQAESAINNGV